MKRMPFGKYKGALLDEYKGEEGLPMKQICMNCKYWSGDKEKANKMLQENPVSMEKFNGWPNDGGCNIDYEWITLEISGDAAVYVTVDANFGCVYWGEE